MGAPMTRCTSLILADNDMSARCSAAAWISDCLMISASTGVMRTDDALHVVNLGRHGRERALQHRRLRLEAVQARLLLRQAAARGPQRRLRRQPLRQLQTMVAAQFRVIYSA